MAGDEDNLLPPLNSHAATAQAWAQTQSMMQQMMVQMSNLANQVAEMKASAGSNSAESTSKQAPSRTVSAPVNVDDEEHDDNDDRSSYASSERVQFTSAKLPVKPPGHFSIDLKVGEALVDKLDELEIFLERLEAYYDVFEMNNNVKLSLNMRIAHLMNLVDNSVFKSIKEVKSRLIANKGTVESIEDLFEDIVLLCRGSEFATAAQLDEIKQFNNEKVEAYFVRFDKLHNRAIREEIANRDVSVLWFVNGLRPTVSRQVKLSIKVNGLIQGTTTVKQALNKCFIAAKAFESDALLDEQPTWRTRPAQPINQHVNQPAVNQSTSYSRATRNIDMPVLSRDEKIKLIMKRHNMSSDEVERHWAKNLCFACHGTSHAANDTVCPKRGKLNMISVESGVGANENLDNPVDVDSQSKNV